MLAQKTPVRVSHRRADLVRSRTIYSLHCEMVLVGPLGHWQPAAAAATNAPTAAAVLCRRLPQGLFACIPWS